jgi:CBS domain-containing protein
MLARDVMVSPVITVGITATVRSVAKILLDNHISAVPVLDDKGRILGIVTEGDLMHRTEAGTEHRRSWWLEMLQTESDAASDYTKSHATKIADIMTKKVVTALPETPLHEIAELLETHGIKRVPIVNKANDLVGIVSRANLLQAVATARPTLELQPPDASIRKALVDHLRQQSWAHSHSLNVTVANGVVDLWGVTWSDEERKALRIAAENIRGVSAVNDHLVNRTTAWL